MLLAAAVHAAPAASAPGASLAAWLWLSFALAVVVACGLALASRRCVALERPRPADTIACMWWLWVPLIILGSAVLVFGILLLLSRFRNGALLRPLIAWLSRFSIMRRFFTRLSTAAIERQNPELASALRKINTVNPDPQSMQKAMSRLTPAERRAYMEAAQEQGGVPDTANRRMRRQAERMQQQSRGGSSSRSGGSRKRKRR